MSSLPFSSPSFLSFYLTIHPPYHAPRVLLSALCNMDFTLCRPLTRPSLLSGSFHPSILSSSYDVPHSASYNIVISLFKASIIPRAFTFLSSLETRHGSIKRKKKKKRGKNTTSCKIIPSLDAFSRRLILLR